MGSENPKVSIALATYNGEKYIDAQLESLAQQSYAPSEIIICDDQSTDQTSERIAAFQKRHPGLVAFHLNDDRLGYVKNFEKAISLCTGDVIALCDQDDVWLPHKVARMVDALCATGHCNLAVANADVVGSNLEPRGQRLYSKQRLLELQSPDAIYTLLHGVGINGCTMAFRRCDVPYLLPLTTSAWGHDHWIALLLAATGRIAVIEEPTMLYRRHSNSGGNNPTLEKNIIRRVQKTLQAKLRHTSIQAYKLHAEKWDRFYRRLAEITPGLQAESDGERMHRLMNEVTAWRDFAQQRYQLQTRQPIMRIPLAITMLRSGNYQKYANGFLAFMKDLAT